MQEKCVVYREEIINPICPSCLALEMEAFSGPKLVPTIRKASKNMCDYIGTCIICGNPVSICAHCYSKDIIEWLNNKENNLDEEEDPFKSPFEEIDLTDFEQIT